MSGLSVCHVCKRYYTMCDKFDIELSGVASTNKDPIYEAVGVCECGYKRVYGGNREYSQLAGKARAICHSRKYEEKDAGLPHFKAVMLERCAKDDPAAEAFAFSKGMTTYLKREDLAHIDSILSKLKADEVKILGNYLDWNKLKKGKREQC